MITSSFDEPYLQSLLEQIARREGFVKPKYEISLGCKPGDNFIGRIFRVVILETSKTKASKRLSLIFKLSPLCKYRQEKLSTDDIFGVEAKMYQTVLPSFNQILNKYGVIKSDTFPGTARCVDVQMNDGSYENQCHVLVLEDMGTNGFSMLPENHQKCFDLNHCQKILRYLALLHAASFALQQIDPEEEERLRKMIYTENMFFANADHPLVTEWKSGAIDGLALLQDPFKKGSKEYEMIEDLVDNFQIEMAKSNIPPSDLSCITHGDCWFNNILYKYNKDGSLNDVCLIDHQLARAASPAVDLIYMFFLCTTKELRDAHYDQLIRYYHDEVSSCLRKMNCDPGKIIPWERLQHHLKKYAIIGILMALTSLPVIIADSSEVKVDVNTSSHEGNIFAGMAKINDPAKLAAVSKRITDVMVDAHRWGYV